MDILEEIGDYSIEFQSPEIKLPDGSLFIPDIVARKNETGQVIYVEVERGTGKDIGYRVQKWINFIPLQADKFMSFVIRKKLQRH